MKSFDEVMGVVASALEVGSSAIMPDTPLGSVGMGPLDVVEVLSRLGVDYSPFISDGNLNDRGRDIFHGLAVQYSRNFVRNIHLTGLALSKTAGEFAARLTARDVYELYRLSHPA